MQLIFADEKLTANSERGQWIGDIACPMIDTKLKKVVVERVFVVPEYRGHGIATQLMQSLVDHAREEHWQLEIMCPYAKKWFQLHTEAQDVLFKSQHNE